MKPKVTFAKWQHNVRKARTYVANYDKVRFIIADLALEVCDYAHGGRKSGEVFSVRRFADAIDMDAKTLYDWVRVKRLVVDKLPKAISSKTQNYLYNDFAEVAEKVTEQSSSADVKRRWQEQIGRNPTEKKFDKYIKYLSTIFYNVSRPVLMKDIPEHMLEQVIEKCLVIAALAKKEIELRKTFSCAEREAKRVNVKAELARRIVASEDGSA